jgi:mono/diheme cytochrome c family protein
MGGEVSRAGRRPGFNVALRCSDWRGMVMKRQDLFFVLAALAGAAISQLAVAQEKQPPTAQTRRGRDLFLKSPKGIACGTCHTMAGVGTAVGPDLARMASLATPRGLVAVIQMESTENVQEIKTAAGTFPGIQKQKQGDDFEIWDLGQTPPVLRKLTSKEILSMNRDQHWKHPPTQAGYSSQELADIVGFLRWAASGSQREIKAAEIE